MYRKILVLGILLAAVLSCDPVEENRGSLVVNCTLYDADGAYPGNFVGVYVWVTDASDNYICTINYYLTATTSNLLEFDDTTTSNDTPTEWKSDSGAIKNGTIDGVSRASQALSAGVNYTFTSSTWKFIDASGNSVPDGDYTIHVNICAEGVETAYFNGIISIDGSGETVSLTQQSGTSNIMTGGTITYTP